MYSFTELTVAPLILNDLDIGECPFKEKQLM